MSKRHSKESKHNYYSPSKKQRLSITIESGSKTNNRQSTSKKQDDIWGDDFPEDVLENIDTIASQAFSQMVNVSNESIEAVESLPSTVTKTSSSWSVPSFDVKTHAPGPKTSPTNVPSTSTNFNHQKTVCSFKPKIRESRGTFSESKHLQIIHDSKINNSNNKKTIPSCETTPYSQSTQLAFGDFKTKLLNENNMNSTFLSQNSYVHVPDDSQLDQIAKLRNEKTKLESNVMTKDGEIFFLRGQLATEKKKTISFKSESSKLLKEQEINFKAELQALKKENDNIATQLKLKILEMNNLKDKTKMLEKGAIKFIEPQSPSFDSGRRNKTIMSCKKNSSVKITYKETATQMEVNNAQKYESKDSLTFYPLQQIPQSIFERSEPEIPIIDIHVVGKIGRRNLPILQETNNLRVFENTEAVKPVVTYVDNKELNVQFFLVNLSKLLNKTTEEINSSDSLPIINMITATGRELLLNTSTSLKKIFDVMINDDIRDMNDFYLSKYSSIKISDIDNIFSGKKLFDKERAIEARRTLAVISHIVETSTYLSEYVTGKKLLKVNDDYFYQSYIKQFNTYNSWSNKDCDFEFLEMILQFVKIMGLTRNAHQFCGAINAIIMILINVQKTVGFCPTGLDYVYKIFREIVFSRPIVENIPAVSEMLMTFANCKEFTKKLCFSGDHSVVSSSSDIWYFKVEPNTCIIEIFISQINKLVNDPIVVMNMSYAIVSFIEKVRPTNAFPWKASQRNSCKCCSLLINFAVKSLYKCMKVSVDELEANFRNQRATNDFSRMSKKEFWNNLKKKQEVMAALGIEFFCHLMNNEYFYIIKRAEMAYTLCQFVNHVEKMFDIRQVEDFESARDRINNFINEPEKTDAPEIPVQIDLMGKTRKLEQSGRKFNQESRFECFSKNLENSS
ncbi:uncharacterized protein LOC122507984 [Leptopilina heterotoma]|uniref:uncharacterized protein LOC122507984 n=1 Tax=Leptopilina heterotoma TaxID=63436 RepID=UPI001CA81ABC|nr:uncharacterized protein LOC122507984 [Leptopilina heterotoma]XP_043476963.1 uncharacterized protein LOC122507984 [Leptopilina heterotoma]XP_043476965.1 uncharacterized protein LOC122507984 [Leptopilina heterotoma]XP_043476966.1 uncharacterized protein LOC122507984 [Leptopilina heterotoma]XP_043476967.1 uncharacterized protein LOC122507984 [Leptopilina heterotoma]